MASRAALIEELSSTFHTIKHRLALSARKKVSITPSQGLALRLIAHQEALTVKGIAAKLGTTSSAATQLVDGLVESGLVRRTVDPADRRSLRLAMTPKAVKTIAKFKEEHVKTMNLLFKALSDAELAAYAKLNKKIAASLDRP